MAHLAKYTLIIAIVGMLTAHISIAKEAVFVIDISTSAPIAVDTAIAKQAGDYVQSYIARLKLGDTIKIRTLGTSGIASDPIHVNVTLSKKHRPHKIAPKVGKIFRSLPKLVKAGKITLQPETSIVGFLETLSPSLNCSSEPTTVILMSDGIESSSQISGNDVFKRGINLPIPSGQILSECNVEIRGLGQQRSDRRTDPTWFPILRTKWTDFFQKAGSANFQAFAYYRD